MRRISQLNVDTTKHRAMQFVDLNAELIRRLALDIHARPEFAAGPPPESNGRPFVAEF